MECGAMRHGSESQDSDDPVPQGNLSVEDKGVDSPSTSSPLPQVSSKGVENAKKRLRAFSIQKKTPIAPVHVAKPVCSGNTTVLIGRLNSVKVTPKPEKPEDESKKQPKPPKPGGSKRFIIESYTDLQRRTLSEIEDMKRKMELVELGIPLGLICPSTNALPVKAMPTKAMPPIKTFLDSAKVDAIIREAKKAKAEGREFKFDYQKFVPDYDNPFQRKKDAPEQAQERPEEKETVPEKIDEDQRKVKSDRDKDKRKIDRFDKKYDYNRDDRFKYKEKFKMNMERIRKEEFRSKEKGDRSRDREDKNKDKIREKNDKQKKDDVEDARKKIEVKKYSRKDSDRPIKKTQENESKETKEADVNLNDFLVCDSWSLDTDDKSSPQIDKNKNSKLTSIDPLEQLRQSLGKKGIHSSSSNTSKMDSPQPKIEKLKPVIDSFKFEIDPNDDEILDIFDEDSDLEKFNTKSLSNKRDSLYDSPERMKYDFDNDCSNDGMNDDTFLESVINEIKLENMSDDETHDKGLVEYDESPVRDSIEPSVGSVTPEMDERVRLQSQRSDYSDGYRSTDSRKSIESGYKSSESGLKSIENNYKSVDDSYKSTDDRYKSAKKSYESGDTSYKSADTIYKSGDNSYKSEDNSYKSGDNSYKSEETSHKYKDTDYKSKNKSKSLRLSLEKDLDDVVDEKITKDTMDSLETWSFVLKICQPLLFRHDKNKCYKETRTVPKLWYTQNPKLCSCVKDRLVVYEELEMCKMGLVDRLYGCDLISDTPTLATRTWYPRNDQCVIENPTPALDMSTEWDIEEGHTDPPKAKTQRLPMTPEKIEEVSLDREYQRFMEAVSWADATDSKQESRSTTPVRHESRKKKIEDREGKRAKKMKMSSDGWSQESEVDEEIVKPVKVDKVKVKRKRKRSSSTLSSHSDDEGKKRKKTSKKKGNKKAKSKAAKRKRMEKKVLKKLKEVKKEKKKKKKAETVEEESEEEGREVKKKEKKVKKKKQKIKKKLEKKKKRVESSPSSSSSSSSDSSSESESESDRKAKKRKKKEAEARKKKEKKKKRKQSTSDSQSDDLFDVNILNNIKKERVEEERRREMSPVAKPREIIDVKELHHEFSHNIQIKQEADEESKRLESVKRPPNPVQTEVQLSKDLEVPEVPKVQEVPKISEDTKVPEVPKVSEDLKDPEVPKLSEEPKVAEVPEVPKVSKVPEVPKVSEALIASKVAEVPEVIKVSEVHKVPKVFEVLEIPKATEVPKVPKVSEVPEVLNVSEVPKIPKVSEVEKVTIVSEVPKVSKASEVSKIPSTKLPKVPKAPKLPEMPKVKEVSRVAEVEINIKKPIEIESEADFMNRFDLSDGNRTYEDVRKGKIEFKEPEIPTPPPRPDETSQCSSQESNMSLKEQPYEKDESHLRPSSQNSNYSFNDVMASSAAYKGLEEKFDGYENYEMYEQLAMAYQSDVASQQISPIESGLAVECQRIETVVRSRVSGRGEIKCDWKAGDGPAPHAPRASRWGLKPGDVNIVLTGGADADSARPQVFRIQSIANRTDTNSMGYDEAYMDMYGASDRLQYGDCFAPPEPEPEPDRTEPDRPRSLDDRITRALRDSVLGEVPKDENDTKESTDKGILVMKSLSESRGVKRVSFADGYKPGQDSDVEEPPVKKRKKGRRAGAAWPVPASHPDHVALWDALPPPPPPPGSPPPPAAALRLLLAPHHAHHKFDPTATMANFMPPEPPPGLISFS